VLEEHRRAAAETTGSLRALEADRDESEAARDEMALELEEAKAARLLHSYSISQTSLEQVFLNISAKARGDSASTEHPAELPGASR
jgi:hypothetical protein